MCVCGSKGSGSGDIGYCSSRDQDVMGLNSWLGIITQRWFSFIAPWTSIFLQSTQVWMSGWYSNIGEGKPRNRQLDWSPICWSSTAYANRGA